MRKDLITWLTLLRPEQYIKNIFIFFPLFFAGEITDLHLLKKACFGFVAFSLLASAVYILNDIKDIKSDKTHPLKQ